MRKIQFRALDPETKIWNYFVIDNVDEITGDELSETIGIGSPIYRLMVKEGRIDFKSWSQFTGILDRNRKSIYDGDVIQHDICKNYKTVQINHKTMNWNIRSVNEPGILLNDTIAGNVYENANLLK